MAAYNAALRANPQSVPAMNAISLILRTREEFHKAVEYLQDILKLEPNNGEAWGSLGKPCLFHTRAWETAGADDILLLGHCFLMMDDLQQAYAAYQNAISYLVNRKVCGTQLVPERAMSRV